VYAIVKETTSLPSDLRGIADEPLKLVTFREIAAVTGEELECPLDTTAALILAHHRLVGRISEELPALPARFGSSVRSLDRLEFVLQEQYQTLLDDLDRLAGKVEFGVTILWNQTNSEDVDRVTDNRPAESGADYMRQQLGTFQREKRLRSLAEKVRSDLANDVVALASEHRDQVLPRDDMPLRGAYLVESADVETFREQVDAFSERYDGLEVVLVGPWPPYSFVSSRQDDLAGMFGAVS
jgi:hypothetical protein